MWGLKEDGEREERGREERERERERDVFESHKS